MLRKQVSAKGQLMSKGLSGVSKSKRKNPEFFVMTSAPATKKRSNQKQALCYIK